MSGKSQPVFSDSFFFPLCNPTIISVIEVYDPYFFTIIINLHITSFVPTKVMLWDFFSDRLGLIWIQGWERHVGLVPKGITFHEHATPSR